MMLGKNAVDVSAQVSSILNPYIAKNTKVLTS